MYRAFAWSRTVVVLLVLMVISSSFVSCTVSPEALQLFLDQALLQGMLTPEQARLIREAARSFQDESRPFSYEEEYEIGRVVAAAVLSQYPVYQQAELTAYVNKIGQGLAFFSARPLLPHGYHVLILDSEEAHAFAAPGGLVLITRGLLKLATSEDMLAALLAHEIAHTALGHGLVSLSSYRMGDLAMRYAMLSTQKASPDNKEVAALLSAAIHDFVALISVQGYSQTMEFEADAEAMRVLYLAGYRRSALKDFIQVLEGSRDGQVQQYSLQHPLPAERLKRVDALEAQYALAESCAVRRQCSQEIDALLRAERSSTGCDCRAAEGMCWGLDVGARGGAWMRGVPVELIRQKRFEAMRLLF